MEIEQYQMEVREWSKKNFGDQPSTNSLLGIMEELGELAHAHLKGIQGIRHTPDEIHNMRGDALGDLFIYMCDYADRSGLWLEEVIETVWNKVKKRNWKEDKQNGPNQHPS